MALLSIEDRMQVLLVELKELDLERMPPVQETRYVQH
jgi:hypothetical protein